MKLISDQDQTPLCSFSLMFSSSIHDNLLNMRSFRVNFQSIGEVQEIRYTRSVHKVKFVPLRGALEVTFKLAILPHSWLNS